MEGYEVYRVKGCIVFILVLLFCLLFVFFLMIRRPQRCTQSRSSAASDVYKRQVWAPVKLASGLVQFEPWEPGVEVELDTLLAKQSPVSYTHLRAHETVLDLVCRLLLEKKNKNS